jgi:DNA replication protein DnaC
VRITLLDNITSETIVTDEKCPDCGRFLEIGILNLFGKKQEYKITCQCVVDKCETEKKEYEAEERRRYIANLRHESGLPLKWFNVSLESFEPRNGTERAYKACCNYAEQFSSLQSGGIGMYLFGTSGGGKSRLAASVANKIIDRGILVCWWNVTSLYLAIQRTFRNDYIGPDILEDCTRAGLLILDDMGAEKPSEWTMATMYDIINSRIENVLPTIITSNLTFEELEKKVDSRVMSRLSDKDIFPRIANTAADYRRQK